MWAGWGVHPCPAGCGHTSWLVTRRAMLEVMELMQMSPDHNVVQVLIVDDQASYRRAARSVVELTPGFVVAGEAYTGEAAVDAARGKMPDLVLMDVHLPGIDGLEACRRILAASNGKRPVIFLLSTYDAAEYVEEQTECGAAAYLTKSEFGSERLAAAWAAATASAGG
jgi:DNA-binding NarL/FixJ family response regulator